MHAATWNHLYKTCIPSQVRHFSSVQSLFLGYNMDIDCIKYVKEKDMKMLEKTSFFPLLKESMARGKAAEVIVTEKEYEFLAGLHYDEKAMGGQAGIMANLFALFPVREVVVYSPAFCTEQAKFLSKSGNIFVPDSECNVVPPSDVAVERRPDYHFIFEFKKGTVGGMAIPRDNRFIASTPMRLQQEECTPLFTRAYEYAVLSGFHLIEDETPLAISRRHVDLLRKRARIHYEAASMQNDALRGKVADFMRGFDSVGMNEGELTSLVELSGEQAKTAVTGLYEGLKTVKERLRVRRAHLHHLGVYMNVIDKTLDPLQSRDSLLFAALFAAVKAKRGSITQVGDGYSGLDVPVSPSGMKMLSELGAYLGDDAFETTGIHEEGDTYVVAIPTRVVADPVKTVGLGDTITGLAFVGE